MKLCGVVIWPASIRLISFRKRDLFCARTKGGEGAGGAGRGAPAPQSVPARPWRGAALPWLECCASGSGSGVSAVAVAVTVGVLARWR